MFYFLDDDDDDDNHDEEAKEKVLFYNNDVADGVYDDYGDNDLYGNTLHNLIYMGIWYMVLCIFPNMILMITII